VVRKAFSGAARRRLKKAKAEASVARTGGTQQPGHAHSYKKGETPTGTPKRPRMEVNPPTVRSQPQKGPGTYKEALTSFKVAIFRETYSEDKITEEDRDSILEILGEALHRTPLEELPRLKSYRLEGGALIYTCVNQQSGQWLIKTIDNHRLGSGAG
jgi:hypothetical protein